MFDYSKALQQITQGCRIELSRCENNIIDSDGENEEEEEEEAEEEESEDLDNSAQQSDRECSSNEDYFICKKARKSQYIPDMDSLKNRNNIINRFRDILPTSNHRDKSWKSKLLKLSRSRGFAMYHQLGQAMQQSSTNLVSSIPAVKQKKDSTDLSTIHVEPFKPTQIVSPSENLGKKLTDFPVAPERKESNSTVDEVYSIPERSLRCVKQERPDSEFVESNSSDQEHGGSMLNDLFSSVDPQDLPSVPVTSFQNVCKKAISAPDKSSLPKCDLSILMNKTSNSTKKSDSLGNLLNRSLDIDKLPQEEMNVPVTASQHVHKKAVIVSDKSSSPTSDSSIPSSKPSNSTKKSDALQDMLKRPLNFVICESNAPMRTKQKDEQNMKISNQTSKVATPKCSTSVVPSELCSNEKLRPLLNNPSNLSSKSYPIFPSRGSFDIEGCRIPVQWEVVANSNTGNISLKKFIDLMSSSHLSKNVELDDIMVQNCTTLLLPSNTKHKWYIPPETLVHKEPASSKSSITHLSHHMTAQKSPDSISDCITPKVKCSKSEFVETLRAFGNEVLRSKANECPLGRSTTETLEMVSNNISVIPTSKPLEAVPATPVTLSQVVAPADTVEMRVPVIRSSGVECSIDKTHTIVEQKEDSVHTKNQSYNLHCVHPNLNHGEVSVNNGSQANILKNAVITRQRNQTEGITLKKVPINAHQRDASIESQTEVPKNTGTTSRGISQKKDVQMFETSQEDFTYRWAIKLNLYLSKTGNKLSPVHVEKLKTLIERRCVHESSVEDFLIKTVQAALQHCHAKTIAGLKYWIIQIIDESIVREFQILNWPKTVEKMIEEHSTPCTQEAQITSSKLILRKRKHPEQSKTQQQSPFAAAQLPQYSGPTNKEYVNVYPSHYAQHQYGPQYSSPLQKQPSQMRKVPHSPEQQLQSQQQQYQLQQQQQQQLQHFQQNLPQQHLLQQQQQHQQLQSQPQHLQQQQHQQLHHLQQQQHQHQQLQSQPQHLQQQLQQHQQQQSQLQHLQQQRQQHQQQQSQPQHLQQHHPQQTQLQQQHLPQQQLQHLQHHPQQTQLQQQHLPQQQLQHLQQHLPQQQHQQLQSQPQHLQQQHPQQTQLQQRRLSQWQLHQQHLQQVQAQHPLLQQQMQQPLLQQQMQQPPNQQWHLQQQQIQSDFQHQQFPKQYPPPPYPQQPFLTTSQQLSNKSEAGARSMRTHSIPTRLVSDQDVSRIGCSPPAANIAPPSFSHTHSVAVATMCRNVHSSSNQIIMSTSMTAYQEDATNVSYFVKNAESLSYGNSYQDSYQLAQSANHENLPNREHQLADSLPNSEHQLAHHSHQNVFQESVSCDINSLDAVKESFLSSYYSQAYPGSDVFSN